MFVRPWISLQGLWICSHNLDMLMVTLEMLTWICLYGLRYAYDYLGHAYNGLGYVYVNFGYDFIVLDMLTRPWKCFQWTCIWLRWPWICFLQPCFVWPRQRFRCISMYMLTIVVDMIGHLECLLCHRYACTAWRLCTQPWICLHDLVFAGDRGEGSCWAFLPSAPIYNCAVT